MRADQSGRLGDVARTDGVHRESGVDLGLAAVDRGERAAVEHELGSKLGERAQDGIPVVHRHGADVGGQQLVSKVRPGTLRTEEGTAPSADRNSTLQAVAQVAAQLPVRPRDQNPHPQLSPVPQEPSAIGARANSGSHQCRFAAYHATVSASPCSHSTDGAQPSSLRSLEASRT